MTNSLIRDLSSIIDKCLLNHSFVLVLVWVCDVHSQFLNSNSTEFKRHNNDNNAVISDVSQ